MAWIESLDLHIPLLGPILVRPSLDLEKQRISARLSQSSPLEPDHDTDQSSYIQRITKRESHRIGEIFEKSFRVSV